MSAFLWVMFWLYVFDMVSRFWCVAQQKLPERTWGGLAFDGAFNAFFLCWVIYLLVAK